VAASGGEARRGLNRFEADMPHAGYDHAAFDPGLGLGPRHAFAERVGIGLRRQTGLRRMVRRGEYLGIDRAVARQAGQVIFGEPRIIVLRAEQVGGEVVSLQETGEIMPDEGAVLDVGRDVLAVFLRLPDHEFGCCRTFDVAVQFGFQRHTLVPVL
jgi:hypothetical protein